MTPSDLARVQRHVDGFNAHIVRRAEERGWPVMDMRRLFKDRTSEEAKGDPSRLNGLFTGTPRPLRRQGDVFLRGSGNTMMGWDGVHPNSAGYSVAANEVIRVLTDKLKTTEYGGLEKGAAIEAVPGKRIKELLIDNYLKLPLTRIYDWQITTVE